MASEAEFDQSLSKGIDIRAWTLTLATDDTGPDPFEHGLPYTPTLVSLQPKASIGTAYPGIDVALTATTCTVTKLDAANTAGTYTLFLGRSPNPQNER